MHTPIILFLYENESTDFDTPRISHHNSATNRSHLMQEDQMHIISNSGVRIKFNLLLISTEDVGCSDAPRTVSSTLDSRLPPISSFVDLPVQSPIFLCTTLSFHRQPLSLFWFPFSHSSFFFVKTTVPFIWNTKLNRGHTLQDEIWTVQKNFNSRPCDSHVAWPDPSFWTSLPRVPRRLASWDTSVAAVSGIF